MGLPPSGLPAVVERRRAHRVTGVRARTERRSLETDGAQRHRKPPDRSRACDKTLNVLGKKRTRGPDNSGNIEGKIKPLCACPHALASPRTALPPAAPASDGRAQEAASPAAAPHAARHAGGPRRPATTQTAGASNPTYTIFALSLRSAEQLAANWSS